MDRREPGWVRRLVRGALRYADHEAFVAALVATLLLVHYWPRALDQATAALGSEVAVGLAILGVVLASMAILVGLMGDEYLTLMHATHSGVRGALRPYLLVAIVAGLTIVAALGGLVGWSAYPEEGQAIALAIATALTIDATVGTVQLVYITAGHGDLRARVIGRMRSWRSSLDERRAELGEAEARRGDEGSTDR
jgi:hypothetical protein